jgi:hypothetical protein
LRFWKPSWTGCISMQHLHLARLLQGARSGLAIMHRGGFMQRIRGINWM